MVARLSEPRIITEADVNPRHDWKRAIYAPGVMNVDFEERIDFRRLHRYRLGRTRQALKKSDLGAVLTFDANNIRYMTSTWIGEWSRDKMTRYALLAGDAEPHVWDFGSAAAHHRIYAPWLDPKHCHAGMLGLRGAVPPEGSGLLKNAAREIKDILAANGVADQPLGVDLVEPPMLFELQKLGLDVRDGQQVMLDAREIKSMDEIMLLNVSASMVDAVYQMIYEKLKPGIRESDIVAMSTKMLYEMGSDNVEAINSVAGERCSPHPHNFTDRLIRPGDQAFFDIIQSYMGYRTCYYRTMGVGRATDAQKDAYKRAREWIDASIYMIKPGVSSADVARVWPKAQDFGFSSEMECFGLQFGHGLGVSLHERPVISRLVMDSTPIEIKEGMVFALETYCPAKDGVSAARIEEEVVVTNDGCRVITLFPAEELPIANEY
jgi:Xaa-Pro dipeptidase